MFYILFDLVACYCKEAHTPCSPEGQQQQQQGQPQQQEQQQGQPQQYYEYDSVAMWFLRGKISVSVPLLNELKVAPWVHLVQHLNPIHTDVRAAATLLLAQRCKGGGDALEAVGGTVFFYNLLSDLNPRVAYYASRFLLEHFDQEKPEEYRNCLTRLVSKARETEDENLVSNPYLQVKALLGRPSGSQSTAAQGQGQQQ
eukprot:TRINITY_DN8141_c0_g1_i1.p1 TRINITY_DN8141_c0_g1~~TRINITY_DN8141_c0_g1_i1.p1  ORF type:complete len:199 (+),score=58.91 TRINITY_DN8141_c0_g1_i1:267-863(+)